MRWLWLTFFVLLGALTIVGIKRDIARTKARYAALMPPLSKPLQHAMPITTTTGALNFPSSVTTSSVTTGGVVTLRTDDPANISFAVVPVPDNSTDATCDASGMHCDPLAESVGDIVRARLGNAIEDDGKVGVFIESDYSDAAAAKYARHLKQEERMIQWADDLPEGRVRSSYLATLEYYQRNTREALTEIKTQDYRKEVAEVTRKQQECDAIASKFSRTHKIPLPPQ